MRKTSPMREWIEERLNRDLPVQVAVSASNSCWWPYLTTSGRVCRREYGYVEDCDCDWDDTLDLRTRSWASVVRLQECLQKMMEA